MLRKFRLIFFSEIFACRNFEKKVIVKFNLSLRSTFLFFCLARLEKKFVRVSWSFWFRPEFDFKKSKNLEKNDRGTLKLSWEQNYDFLKNRKFWIWIRSDWLLTNDVCCKQISLHLLESNKQSFKTFILIGSCDLKNFSKFGPIHFDLIHPRFLSRLSPDIVNGPWLCHFRTPGHFIGHIHFLRHQPVCGHFYQNLKFSLKFS